MEYPNYPSKYGLINQNEYNKKSKEINLDNSDLVISERDNILLIDTRDCIGEESLKQARLNFVYDKIAEGQISVSEFQETLTDGLVDENKLISKGFNFTNFPDENNLKPTIKENHIDFYLKKELKQIISLEIANVIIPRDIIPLTVYVPNFIKNCIPDTQTSFVKNSNVYSTDDSPVPPDLNEYNNNIEGFYESSMRFWRTYTGYLAMQNSETPPPHQLWNPQQGNWPFQPEPKYLQRCPTYRSKNGVIFSGYGLYDLEDFPHLQEITLQSGIKVQIPLRKLILKLIVPKGQIVNGETAENLIDKSEDHDDLSDPLTQTGYGDYQRFLPGPGLGMNYQPNQARTGKPAPIADLGISTYNSGTGVLGSMPIEFPNFTGNYWGPYDNPGDRFQNNGLRQTLDELYLNGDLENIEGNPIIDPEYDPTTEAYTYERFFDSQKFNTKMTFRNFESCSNLNIKNAMRLTYETTNFIDLGSENGKFISEMTNYRSVFLSSVQNTDIVIKIRNASRTMYTQSMNISTNESNFNIPVRLNLGTTTGTQEYIESLHELIAGSGKGFWEHNFYPPKKSMKSIRIEFYTYDNKPIMLEKNLGFRKTVKDNAVLLAQSGISNNIILKLPYTEENIITNNFVASSAIITSKSDIKENEQFNPELVYYTNRNISMILKYRTYHSEGAGITEIISEKNRSYENLKQTTSYRDSNGNNVKLVPLASNIDEYSM